MNVGDLRKAIEGLADDVPVLLSEHYADDAPDDIDITLEDVEPDVSGLYVKLRIDYLDPYGDDDDDFDDEIEIHDVTG